MTSNKHKRSTPHKSPQNSSTHKPHKPQRSHKSPQEKARPLIPNSSNSPNPPILPPKYVRAARPILPPTRRVLFPQNSKQSNSQQLFSSPPPAKKDHSRTGKHALSPSATDASDHRPFKKQCLSSPPPAKSTKLVPTESSSVDRRARMSTSNDDDEDEDEDEEGTLSPPSRKRKTNAIAGAAERHKKPALSVATPPKAAVSNATPPKHHPSPFSTTQPNSKAVNMIDITVIRLEKEELQKRLDTSVQQAQQANNEVKKWETKCKATIDTQETLNRLLHAEMEEKEKLQRRLDTFTQQAHGLKLEAKDWEDRWKETSEENNSLRKRLGSKTMEHDAAEANTEQWQLQHRIQTDKNIKLQRELKQAKKRSEKDHIQDPHQFANKVVQLEQELSELKSQNTKIGHRKEHEEYLEATNKLLARQVAQLKEDVQHKDELEKQITQLQEELRNTKEKSSEKVVWQRDDRAKEVTQLKEVVQNTKNELAKNIARLKEEIKQNDTLIVQYTQLQEDLSFKTDLASQASRTHSHETSTLHQKITHLQSQLNNSNQELRTLHEELLSKNEEIECLTSDHSIEIQKLKEERHNLEVVNRYKDMGLEKMGLLVAGWTLKWQSIGAGARNGAEGKIPGVEGLGVCVNGVRM
ncbi:hypothetical protein EAF04_002481 [Stromatinia cepivora]|nr:hypothetical protein EAF04_002481 [Stromatinia cepivora]